MKTKEHRQRARLRKPLTAASVLRKELDKLGLFQSLAKYRIVERWPKICGRIIAAHTEAEKIVGSTLIVLVDSSVWLNELAGQIHILLHRVNSDLPKGTPGIKNIRFRQCSWITHEHEKEQSRPVLPEPSKAEINAAKALVAEIKDPDLQNIFFDLMEKDMRLKIERVYESADKPKQTLEN